MNYRRSIRTGAVGSRIYKTARTVGHRLTGNSRVILQYNVVPTTNPAISTNHWQQRWFSPITYIQLFQLPTVTMGNVSLAPHDNTVGACSVRHQWRLRRPTAKCILNRWIQFNGQVCAVRGTRYIIELLWRYTVGALTMSLLRDESISRKYRDISPKYRRFEYWFLNFWIVLLHILKGQRCTHSSFPPFCYPVFLSISLSNFLRLSIPGEY